MQRDQKKKNSTHTQKKKLSESSTRAHTPHLLQQKKKIWATKKNNHMFIKIFADDRVHSPRILGEEKH